MAADSAGVLLLYVRDGCHLCDQFLMELSLELGGHGAELQVVDVNSDAALQQRFGLRVPVLEYRGAVLGEGRFDRSRFRELYPV